MTSVAVIAHSGRRFGGGLGELRLVLGAAGVGQPLWYEVAKSRQVPDCAREAIQAGADLLFVWGGDGKVQRCVDTVAGTGIAIAILPAGTANLLAKNLGVPQDIAAAVEIGLHGDRRPLDTGTVNGEHFAVMAGAGLDALMIRDADAGLKDRVGRAAYLWTWAKNLGASPVRAKVDVEGRRFFKGTIRTRSAHGARRILRTRHPCRLSGVQRPDRGPRPSQEHRTGHHPGDEPARNRVVPQRHDRSQDDPDASRDEEVRARSDALPGGPAVP